MFLEESFYYNRCIHNLTPHPKKQTKNPKQTKNKQTKKPQTNKAKIKIKQTKGKIHL